MKLGSRFTILVSLGALAILPVTAHDRSEWPVWQSTINHPTDQHLDLETGHGLKVVWQQKLGSGYSSISIADGRAVTMFSDGSADFVIALDAHSGAEQWRYRIDDTYKGHDGSHDGPIATPAIDGRRVFAVGPKGQLLALDLLNGKPIWTASLKEMGSVEPRYGWATSPLVSGEVLIVQTGAGEGKSVTGFDKRTGKQLWSAGDATILYQSPILANYGGLEQVICLGDKALLGLDPASGKVLWQYDVAAANGSANPIPAGPDRLFISTTFQAGIMLSIKKEGEGFAIEKLWESSEIKSTNDPPVYAKGYLYGYSGRFLTCVDAATGKRAWKSRPPGDGFTTLVDNHLIIITKQGTLHVVKASPEGYQELMQKQVFNSLGWNPASYAYGKIYLRNLADIACMTIAEVPAGSVAATSEDLPAGLVAGSMMAKLREKVAAAKDKKAVIDAFMKQHPNSPVFEGERLAHIIFRGTVEDVGLVGDMFNNGEEKPLNNIEGTEFFYFTVDLEPDAHLGYSLSVDFENPAPDPLNPRKGATFNGERSTLAMPAWTEPAHLKESGSLTGRLESFDFSSKVTENSRKITVYLPPGYEAGSDRYAALYVHYGQLALDNGKLQNSLDNLIGKTVAPVIAVFVHMNPEIRFREVGSEPYLQMMAEELVPHIDGRYRTRTEAAARAMAGGSSGGYASMLGAFKYPQVFGMAGGQSTNIDQARKAAVFETVRAAGKQDLRFYLDWGLYDLRNAGGELRRAADNRELTGLLVDLGYRVDGGQVNQGYDWDNWRTRYNLMLESLFPLDPAR